jgi:large subunit ribosomal protein L34
MSKTMGPSYNPSKIKRIRKYGYMARNTTRGGKKVLKRRILKGRHDATVSHEFGSTKIEKNKRFGRRR